MRTISRIAAGAMMSAVLVAGLGATASAEEHGSVNRVLRYTGDQVNGTWSTAGHVWRFFFGPDENDPSNGSGSGDVSQQPSRDGGNKANKHHKGSHKGKHGSRKQARHNGRRR